LETQNKGASRRLWLWLIPLILVIIYVGGALHYQHRYLPRTEVFGIKIAGKTPTQAATILNKNIQTTKYTFKEGDKTVLTTTGAKLGISRNFTAMLNSVKDNQSAWSWPVHIFTQPTASLHKTATLINQSTLDQFAAGTADNLNQTRIAPRNAKLAFKNGQLVTTKERNGNQISAAKLAAQTKQQILANHNTINLKKAYDKPQITVGMQSFKKLKAKLTKISHVAGVLKLQNHRIKVSKQEVQSWISIDGTSMAISESKIGHYLDQLDHKYATYYKTRHFKSTARGTVSVPAGIYGWSISQKKEIPVIVNAINAGHLFTHKVTVKGTGYHADGTDIGNTYVEVDKQNQMEYYYKDGKLAMSSAVVTGNPNKGKETPSGVFYIWSKQRNATLRGANYATKVSYWMPVDDTGVGLHDSPWQPQYGGSWYLTHGSHGCVNNPPAFAAQLYNAVSVGTPVIIF
jgi:lipoprotein-anchoring transpeptidase ErfK/SrfK